MHFPWDIFFDLFRHHSEIVLRLTDNKSDWDHTSKFDFQRSFHEINLYICNLKISIRDAIAIEENSFGVTEFIFTAINANRILITITIEQFF